MIKKLLFYLVLMIFGIAGVAGACLCHPPDCPGDSEFTIWTDHYEINSPSLSYGQSAYFEFDITPEWNGDLILAAWTVFHFQGGERDWYLGQYDYDVNSGGWTQYELIHTNINGHAWEAERLWGGALSSLQDDGFLSGIIKNITPDWWNCSDREFSVKEAWLIAKGCDTNPVPEPATLLLLGTGLIAFAGIGRRKILKKKKK